MPDSYLKMFRVHVVRAATNREPGAQPSRTAAYLGSELDDVDGQRALTSPGDEFAATACGLSGVLTNVHAGLTVCLGFDGGRR